MKNKISNAFQTAPKFSRNKDNENGEDKKE